jgi:hypothetical protein
MRSAIFLGLPLCFFTILLILFENFSLKVQSGQPEMRMGGKSFDATTCRNRATIVSSLAFLFCAAKAATEASRVGATPEGTVSNATAVSFSTQRLRNPLRPEEGMGLANP